MYVCVWVFVCFSVPCRCPAAVGDKGKVPCYQVDPEKQEPEPWTSQEGEQFQRLGEADINVPVKSEDDEEKPQSSQFL